MGAKQSERPGITYLSLKAKTSDTDGTPFFGINEKVGELWTITKKFDAVDGHLTKKNTLSGGGAHSILLFLLFFIYVNIGISIRGTAQIGMMGAKTISTTNVILNEFTTLTANASAGATSITVAHSSLNDSSRFSGSLAAGELVMIIQMQGATLKSSSTTDTSWGSITSYNNAGLFEFDQVASVPNGTTINLVSALLNSYTDSGNVQVIRVPRYTTLTVNSGASITTQAWNGSMGGVIATEASGNVTINGTIDADSMGFRGGALTDYSNCCPNGLDSTTFATTDSTQGAEKGEGIAGYITTYRGLGGPYGRGAAANGGGGGNAHNGGGGGGANGSNGITWNGKGIPDTTTNPNWKTAWDLEGNSFHKNVSSGGGRGGYSYSRDNPSPLTTAPGNSSWSGDNRENVGGYGGRPLSNSGNRIYMGGGGGAGDENQNMGSAGANGGGIVYLLVGGTLSGSGTIEADGGTAGSTVAVGGKGGVDGAGGAGGGGSVIIYNPVANASGVTINATGGQGGDQVKYGHDLGSSEAEGPGGGGGGGYISVTSPNTLTTNANGGKNGTTNSTALSTFLPNGATMGTSSTITIPTNPYSGSVPLPITLLNFSGIEKNNIVTLSWTTACEINNNYFTLERSGDGKNYSFLARAAGAGNSNATRTYYYQDDSPLIGGNYYLLSQTDYDGKTVTFYPIYVKSSLQSGVNYIVNAGPIPFDDQIKINYSITNGGTIEVSIINITGQVVKNESLAAGEGMNSFVLNNLSFLAEGIYFLRITGDDTNMSLKMIKN